MNIPAVIILFLLTALLVRGTKESALVNGLIVITKVTIVLMVIGIGWSFMNPANHNVNPGASGIMALIPPNAERVDAAGISHHYGGIMGILGAAGVVFFAFIGI